MQSRPLPSVSAAFSLCVADINYVCPIVNYSHGLLLFKFKDLIVINLQFQLPGCILA